MSGSQALSEETAANPWQARVYLNNLNHSLSPGVASFHLQEGFWDCRKGEGLFNNWPNLQNTRRDNRLKRRPTLSAVTVFVDILQCLSRGSLPCAEGRAPAASPSPPSSPLLLFHLYSILLPSNAVIPTQNPAGAPKPNFPRHTIS